MQPPTQCPLRVDFAGGWLDVPRLARPGAYIVNCAIAPLVSLQNWPYQQNSGLGGSAAWALLNGRDPVTSELQSGAGWQDPAIIQRGGMAAWRSGPAPELVAGNDGQWLRGLLALHWTGKPHRTTDLAGRERDYDVIAEASLAGYRAVAEQEQCHLIQAVHLTYLAQIDEGMEPIPSIYGSVHKYCGSGHGGYAVYLFHHPHLRDNAVAKHGLIPVEPYALKTEPAAIQS